MSAAQPTSRPDDWTRARRLGFRFAFAYSVLYFFPFPEGSVPATLWLSDAYANFWYRIDARIGRHVLGIVRDIPVADTGSGDRTCDYIHLACNFVLVLAITIGWSVLDRRRREYATLSEWLRVYLRYVLAFVLLLYGVIKLMGGQFFPPSILRLNETFGQASPQVLLWTFMGASAPYTFFVGAAEALSGLLLYARRTATIGAIVAAIVLANVVMMNFCYDVPVKQYSLHLLLATLFLLLPDAQRLFDFFFMHRASLLPAATLHFSSSKVMRLARALKALAIGAAIHRAVTLSWTAVQSTVRSPPSIRSADTTKSKPSRRPLHHPIQFVQTKKDGGHSPWLIAASSCCVR